MDSDDILELEALEFLVPKMEEENLDILYFNTRCFAKPLDLETRFVSKWTYFGPVLIRLSVRARICCVSFMSIKNISWLPGCKP